jgi:hypothetical protein
MKDGLLHIPEVPGGSVSNGMRKWSKPTLRSFWQLMGWPGRAPALQDIKSCGGLRKHKEHVPCQPTPAQRAALDELQDASVKAAERLKVDCPSYQTLTPTGRVEAMEKRLEATLAAVKAVQPALAKFYNSLSDEQKARFNSLRSSSRPTG